MTKARRVREDMQDYRNQRYIGASLDNGYFEALLGHVDILYHHGAMDAPTVIPAGSMKGFFGGFDRSTVERGVDLVEQQEIDAFMYSLIEGDTAEVPEELT
jgi:hypothetical protein